MPLNAFWKSYIIGNSSIPCQVANTLLIRTISFDSVCKCVKTESQSGPVSGDLKSSSKGHYLISGDRNLYDQIPIRYSDDSAPSHPGVLHTVLETECYEIMYNKMQFHACFKQGWLLSLEDQGHKVPWEFRIGVFSVCVDNFCISLM